MTGRAGPVLDEVRTGLLRRRERSGIAILECIPGSLIRDEGPFVGCDRERDPCRRDRRIPERSGEELWIRRARGDRIDHIAREVRGEHHRNRCAKPRGDLGPRPRVVRHLYARHDRPHGLTLESSANANRHVVRHGITELRLRTSVPEVPLGPESAEEVHARASSHLDARTEDRIGDRHSHRVATNDTGRPEDVVVRIECEIEARMDTDPWVDPTIARTVTGAAGNRAVG